MNKAQPKDFLDVLLKDKYVEYDDAMPTTLNIGEIIKGLDVFFAEPANANITVRHALFIFTGKAQGWSSALLQSLTEMARKADN